MFKGLGNIASLMKNAQNIGGKMGEISEELKSKRVTGAAGGGMITVQANGLGHILSVQIDPMLIEKQEGEMIQDLLPAAINDAVVKSKQLHMEAMQSVTGGLPIPGLDDALKNFTGNGEEPTAPDSSDDSNH